MHDYGWGMGWGMWFIPVLIILVIYLLIRNDAPVNRTRTPDSPMEILKKRYARGEITKEQFDAMKQDVL